LRLDEFFAALIFVELFLEESEREVIVACLEDARPD
jgi:hypothetical protein